eukprot:9502582-Pyramimonas_sp.AAC.1
MGRTHHNPQVDRARIVMRNATAQKKQRQVGCAINRPLSEPLRANKPFKGFPPRQEKLWHTKAFLDNVEFTLHAHYSHMRAPGWSRCEAKVQLSL